MRTFQLSRWEFLHKKAPVHIYYILNVLYKLSWLSVPSYGLIHWSICTNCLIIIDMEQMYVYVCQYLISILPRLLQRSKKCRGHYSTCTLYHATSQWIMRSDTHLFFWHNVRISVPLKFKIMSITCRFHVSDVVLAWNISY